MMIIIYLTLYLLIRSNHIVCVITERSLRTFTFPRITYMYRRMLVPRNKYKYK